MNPLPQQAANTVFWLYPAGPPELLEQYQERPLRRGGIGGTPSRQVEVRVCGLKPGEVISPPCLWWGTRHWVWCISSSGSGQLWA